MAGNDPNNQPRRYKRYLVDAAAKVPVRTMHHRRLNAQDQVEPNPGPAPVDMDMGEIEALMDVGDDADSDPELDAGYREDSESDDEEIQFMLREEAILIENEAELQELEEDAELEVNSDEEVPPLPEEPTHNLNFPGGDQPVSSEGTDMKKMDSLLAVLSYAVKHHLSGVALQDLINLINLHCPNTLPSSMYLFGSAFTDYKGLCQFHFYCKCSKVYIGCGDDIEFSCNKCGAEFNRDESMKNGQFFIVLPLAQQLQHLLQYTEVGDTIINRDLKVDAKDEDDITDITDGVKYREMKREGLLANSDNFSLLWNTDGVPIFKSSQSSIWPVLVMINELPMKMRRQNIMMTALWFGESKPDMTVFLKPFVGECQRLSTEGLQWKMGEDQKVSKVFSLVCSVDTVARPLLQNTTQFNGFYGCNFCMQRGEYYERAMKYPYVDPPPPQRTDEQTKHTSLLAQESGKAIEGVKGVSILSLIMYFNIVLGFIPDYMHAVCLGTVKRFLTLWLDSANRQKEWFIGRSREEIDRRLKNVKVTKEISRLPRHLKDLKFWKASEWRTFLYISPVILTGILPVTYLAHWSLLVCAIYNLNQARVSQYRLRQSEFYLRKFVLFIEPLYGKGEATFNNHLLLHITDSVKNWGPLWGTSAFAFESYNGYIKTLFAGTRYLPVQIFKSLCHIQDLTRNLPFINSPETLMYVRKMLTDNHCVKNATRIVDDVHNIVCIGRGKVLTLTEQYKRAIQEFLGDELLVDSVKCFDKFVYKNCLFTSKSYSMKFRRINSIISAGMEICEILHLVTFKNHGCESDVQCQCKEHIIVLVETLPACRKMTIKHGDELGCTIHFISEVSRGHCKAYSYQEIACKSMFVKSGEVEYVISLPNLIESD